MMDELITWLRAQLDEDERIALAASGRDDEKPGEFAERWEWVHTGDPNPAYPGHALVDQPVDMARWQSEVHVGGNGPDYAGQVSLRSIEEYPTSSGVGPLPHFVIHQTEELEVAVARHIARHDPARVLREVEAKRKIIELVTDAGPQFGDGYTEAYRDVVKLLALSYANRPGYREEWRP